MMDGSREQTPAKRPPLPGKILTERYLVPLGISVTELANATGLARQYLSKIINGRARITAETAVRLGRALNVEPRRWLELQEAVDLFEAEHRSRPEAVRRLATNNPNAGAFADDVCQSLNTLLADPNGPAEPRHTPAEAVARIFELRKGNSLPDNMTLKELIALGRD